MNGSFRYKCFTDHPDVKLKGRPDGSFSRADMGQSVAGGVAKDGNIILPLTGNPDLLVRTTLHCNVTMAAERGCVSWPRLPRVASDAPVTHEGPGACGEASDAKVVSPPHRVLSVLF